MKRTADSSVRVMQWMSVFLDANEFEGMFEVCVVFDEIYGM